MEAAVKLAWGLLALVHLPPAAVAIAPRLVERLYGVSPGGDMGVMLVHRGVLFFAVLAVAVLALFDPSARRAASLVAAISIGGFLAVYAAAGAPAGPLRRIAWVDLAALAPLALVVFEAWRPRFA
ncbi:MAG: hypothetical protein AAFX03_01495 [Pseudomonadota bacterium]